jgi:hypothetical protein
MHQGLTAERLREVLTYDPVSGAFQRRNSRRIRPLAGTINTPGYSVIKIDKKLYAAHRLAWLYVHGVWPSGLIDHINGIRTDNRIANLRDGSDGLNQQNMRKAQVNSKSGLLGAHADKRTGRWQANIMANRRAHRLGTFATAEEAHAAYLEAKRRLHKGCTI